MKKMAAIFLLLTMPLVLTACGGEKEMGTSTNGETKLKMWVHISDDTLEGKAYKQRAEAFNKEYEGQYEVQVEFIARGGGGTGYDDKLNAALTTNGLPDVLALDGPNTAAYAKSGVLLDINEHISDESKSDLVESALQQGSYNGGLYSLPIQESTCLIYYNKDMFLEAGIINSIETAEQDLGISVDNPWTFDEFIEISNKLKATFNKPAIDLHLGSQDEWITYAIAPFIWTSGGELISKDGLTAEGYFNSVQAKEGFTFVKTLIDTGISTITPEENAFEMGTYPMALSGAWTVPIMNITYAEQVPNWGVLPYPVGSTGELHAPTGSWAFGVSKSTKNPEAAAKLAEWMTNTESTALVAESTGLLPARHSAYELSTTYDEGAYKMMRDQLIMGGHPRPSTVAYPELTFAFQQAVDRITNGQTVNETIDQVATQLDVKLARHKK